MQAVALADVDLRHLVAARAVEDAQQAAELRPPGEAIDQGGTVRHESLHVEDVRRQVEGGVGARQGEVVHRARRVERMAAAQLELAPRVEAVEGERRPVGRERDAEVHHLAAVGIERRVGGERAHRVEPAAEGVLPERLQGLRVELPRQPLLAVGQQPPRPRVDRHVDRRRQRDAAHQPVAREGGAEGAVEGAPRRLLLGPLRRTYEAVDEAGAAVGVEGERAHHAVAVEPMPVAHLAAGEAGRSVDVVGAAHEVRHGALDLGGRDAVVRLRRHALEQALEAGGEVGGRRGGDGSWQFPQTVVAAGTGAAAARASAPPPAGAAACG